MRHTATTAPLAFAALLATCAVAPVGSAQPVPGQVQILGRVPTVAPAEVAAPTYAGLVPAFDGLTIQPGGFYSVLSFGYPCYFGQPFSTATLPTGRVVIEALDVLMFAPIQQSWVNIEIGVRFWQNFNPAATTVFSGGTSIFTAHSGPFWTNTNSFYLWRLRLPSPVVLDGASHHGVAVLFKGDTGDGLAPCPGLRTAYRWDGGPFASGSVPLPAPQYGFYSAEQQMTDYNFPEGFGATPAPTYNGLAIRIWQRANKGDFDADGNADLVLEDTASSAHNVWMMDGAVRIASSAISPVIQPGWRIVGVDDFNRDTLPDLLVRGPVGELALWRMAGTTRVGSPLPLQGAPDMPLDWEVVATGDFDRDGFPDLLWRHLSSQELVIWTLVDLMVKAVHRPLPELATDSNWTVVAALDYDGNDTRDILWFNRTSGKIVFWLMDQEYVRVSGRFANPPSAGGAAWKVVASENYGTGTDGIVGTNDIVWRHDVSGNLVIWYLDHAGNRTSGVFTSPSSPQPNPTAWRIVGPR